MRNSSTRRVFLHDRVDDQFKQNITRKADEAKPLMQNVKRIVVIPRTELRRIHSQCASLRLRPTHSVEAALGLWWRCQGCGG